MNPDTGKPESPGNPIRDAARPPTPPNGLFTAAPEADRTRRRRRAHRLAWALAIPCGLLAAGLALAPALLSSGPVRRALVGRANAMQPETVLEIADWHWRWRSPCRIDGIALRTRDQTASLHIGAVTFSRGLAAWIGRRQRFGTITVEQPAWRRMELPPAGAGVQTAVSPASPPAKASVSAHLTAPSGTFSLLLNPFGTLQVRGGRGEIFPIEGPAVRLADLALELTLDGRAGPVALKAQGGIPRRPGGDAAPGAQAAFALEARAASLQDLGLAPGHVPFEVKATLAPVELAALAAFLPPDPLRPVIRSGLVEAAFSARRDEGAERTLEARMALRNLELAGGALGQDVVQWDRAVLALTADERQGSLNVREFRLDCPWAQVRASGTLAPPPTGGPRSTARLIAEGRLDLAAAAIQLPATLRLRPGVTLRRAELRFDAELATEADGGTRAFLMVRCDGLDALHAGRPLDLPKPLFLSLAGALAADALTLREFRAQAGPLELAGAGALTDLDGERRLVLEGLSRINLDAAAELLRHWEAGRAVAWSGRSEQPFRIATPLRGGRRYLLTRLEAEAGLQARRCDGFGLHVQDALLALQAARGTLRLDARATLDEGALHLDPRVDLLSEPPLLTLEGPTRALDDARLTDALLDRHLARLHPVLKGCAVAGGRISLDLARLSLPFAADAPHRMTWDATLHLRDVRLTAAGPLGELAAALRLKRREVVLADQAQTVACRDGRFEAQPLALTLDGHPLRISGSVGLDGSLDYGIETALTRELVGDRAYRFLEGRTVRIPLTGTAAKPMLDVQALEAEARRLAAAALARAAAENLRETDPKPLQDALRRLGR